jgi:carbon starvation protein
MDGIDILPSPQGILTSYQFKSISLDVVIGPVIAIQFGWLPAILWLLVGTVFFGWIQDYLVTIISMRSGGKSLSQLITIFFKPELRSAILIFILIYMLTILGQFGILLSTLLGSGTNLFSILILVLAGFLAGQMIYRWRFSVLFATTIPVILVILGFLFTSTSNFQGLSDSLTNLISSQGPDVIKMPFGSGSLSWQALISITVALGICYLGAVLPVWRFTVPFNYVSAWMVLLAMAIAGLGYFFGILSGTVEPQFEIPAFTTSIQPTIGPIWPILFVTLSSGAISGWNALVSTFTTSRQVEKEPLTLPITAGAKFTETMLVTLVIIFAATFGVSSGTFNPEQDFGLVAGPASVFAIGMARTISALGLPGQLGNSFSALLLTMMILTIMQLAMRITRIVGGDLFTNRRTAFTNPSLITIIVILIILVIIFFGFWQWLWILFAGANQMLAAIALLLASIWLAKRMKSYWWTFWPAVFIFITALAALFYSAIYQPIISVQGLNPDRLIGSLLVFIFGLVFIISGGYIFIHGFRAFIKARENKPKSKI